MARKLTTKAITDDAITADKIVAGAVVADIGAGTVTPTHLHSSLDLSSKTLTLPAASVTHANLHSTMDLSSKTVTLPSLATLEVSAGAPTISLNSPGQVTDKKTNRIAVSQYTAGDFSVQQINDNVTGIHRTPFLINNAGNVGIGVTSPDSLLHLQKTRGTLSGGTSDTGAVLKLHTEAQWESGYGNNAGTSTNDFLGSVEFSSGDSSTGEGVRAAIRLSLIQI